MSSDVYMPRISFDPMVLAGKAPTPRLELRYQGGVVGLPVTDINDIEFLSWGDKQLRAAETLIVCCENEDRMIGIENNKRPLEDIDMFVILSHLGNLKHVWFECASQYATITKQFLAVMTGVNKAGLLLHSILVGTDIQGYCQSVFISDASALLVLDQDRRNSLRRLTLRFKPEWARNPVESGSATGRQLVELSKDLQDLRKLCLMGSPYRVFSKSLLDEMTNSSCMQGLAKLTLYECAFGPTALHRFLKTHCKTLDRLLVFAPMVMADGDRTKSFLKELAEDPELQLRSLVLFGVRSAWHGSTSMLKFPQHWKRKPSGLEAWVSGIRLHKEDCVELLSTKNSAAEVRRKIRPLLKAMYFAEDRPGK